MKRNLKSESTTELRMRPVSESDLPGLVRVAKKALTLDSVDAAYVKFRLFRDPDFDPELSLGAFDRKGELVSFVSASQPSKFPLGSKPPESKAWLKVFFTSPTHRRKGLASTLMKRILSELEARGVSEIRFSDRGNWHFWPGLDLRYEEAYDFLVEKFGFSKVGEELDYIYDLSKFVYPRRVARLKSKLESEGIIFGRPRASERKQVCAWIEENFSAFWAHETESAFKNREPTVFVAREKMQDGRAGLILGFATYSGLAKRRFGPTGVDDKERGRGIGAVLLFDSLQSMKSERLGEAVVHWTDHLFFYTQAPGIRGVRHYWILSRKIP